MSLTRLLARKLARQDQDRLVQRSLAEILKVCKPRKVILFGSTALFEMTEASDLDYVVGVGSRDEVKTTQQLLNRVAAKIDWPMDCLVIDEDHFTEKAAEGGVYFVAKTEGKVVYQ
jgi:predicted nucleotidyltransferase